MPVGPASGGGGGKSGDVRAGGAFVEISAKDRLSAQLAGLLARTKAFAATLQKVGRVTALAGAGALTPLAGLFGAGTNRAADIERMADQLGTSVEQMQRLKFAADAAGVSVEDVLRAPEKYAGLMGQATVLDAATIRQAARANEELAGAWVNLQSAMLPVVQTVGPLVSKFAEFVRQNGPLVRGIAFGAAAMIGLGAAAVVAGKGLALVAGAVGVVSTAFSFLLSRTGLILVGVGGLAAAFLTLTTGGQRLAAGVGEAFGRMGQTFGAMMKGIGDAIAKGDFETAFKVFTTGVEAVWYEMILNMAKAFGTFIDNNRDRLLALGALMGGLKGAGMGGRFGPWGALFGGAVGALGGGVAVDQLAELVKGIANNTGLEEKRLDAQKRLAELNKQAAAPVGRPAENPESLAKRITATRGAFRLLGDASQQFGQSRSIDSEQLVQLVQIKKTLDRQTQLQIEALNAGRFK